MDRMKWIIFGAIVVTVFGAIVWFNKSDSSFIGDASKIITDGPIVDHVYGPTKQKVVLIEYGDFQCPACRNMFDPVKELKEKYKDKLTFIFRNFPLTSIHPHALAAASVAEAAGRQGKFWEMHDTLYQNQDSWTNASPENRSVFFEMYANGLGLDVVRFKQDLTDPAVSAKITRDRQTAKLFKVNSTPTFVIDGKMFDTSKSTDATALTTAVEEALRAAYGADALAPPAIAEPTQ